MPKSKRDKKISLKKTNKMDLAVQEQKMRETFTAWSKEFKNAYVFEYAGGRVRHKILQDISDSWKPSGFLFAKTKDKSVGLSKDRVSKQCKGPCAFLFTNCTRQEVVDWYKSFEVNDYCRSGSVATTTVKLLKGPLKQFSHNMESYLRQLGLPIKIEKGNYLKYIFICNFCFLFCSRYGYIIK